MSEIKKYSKISPSELLFQSFIFINAGGFYRKELSLKRINEQSYKTADFRLRINGSSPIIVEVKEFEVSEKEKQIQKEMNSNKSGSFWCGDFEAKKSSIKRVLKEAKNQILGSCNGKKYPSMVILNPRGWMDIIELDDINRALFGSSCSLCLEYNQKHIELSERYPDLFFVNHYNSIMPNVSPSVSVNLPLMFADKCIDIPKEISVVGHLLFKNTTLELNLFHNPNVDASIRLSPKILKTVCTAQYRLSIRDYPEDVQELFKITGDNLKEYYYSEKIGIDEL